MWRIHSILDAYTCIFLPTSTFLMTIKKYRYKLFWNMQFNDIYWIYLHRFIRCQIVPIAKFCALPPPLTAVMCRSTRVMVVITAIDRMRLPSTPRTCIPKWTDTQNPMRNPSLRPIVIHKPWILSDTETTRSRRSVSKVVLVRILKLFSQWYK